MKKFLLIISLVTGSLLFAQSVPTKVYENDNYSITLPEGWKVTNDSDIINIFPGNEIGAITISEYHDLNLPKTETKKFILALYKSSDDEKKIKSKSGKKGYTEYFYEYDDDHEKLHWITKVFQKDKDLFLVTINCTQKYWNGNYMKLFNEAFDSFKIKK
ncbi:MULTISPECIES: hypothetical protein [Chryseobacterium]|uniref:DUF1795 domain-containing protein n=2 Tax=Chryseobacterium gambrini TaxID=373672 RepID=A0A1N7PAJ6_9FLAO|nr:MULTISPECIES: hypothetical protein [Chryseobacterium]MCY1661404.1 hypothetical protein [Chryseobacterium sp. SL1]WBX96870.1 hypothetical protein PE065_18785 [Chryseobacterium gambrini]SIT07655.1 hypothetical protein SAMN05421785_106114 [Chryseobacterium gambrini]HAO07219.1 hypothetical protein [Chryseobacterium sp.]